MSVVYLTNNPNLGSTARILQFWLERSKADGERAAVVVPRDGAFAAWLRSAGVPFLIDPMPWPSRSRPMRSMWHLARVVRFLQRHNATVVHCNEHDVYPFASALRRFVRRPMICHVRFQISEDFARWAFAGRRCPEALLWTSYQQMEDCRVAAEVVPKVRQHVVRLGIDVNKFSSDALSTESARAKWDIRPGEIVIGTASPLRPRKKVEDFVTVASQLAANHPNVVGLLAGGEIPGDENYRALIESQIAATGLGRRLRWVGDLQDIASFYRACDIVISTSEYETFGNSVCEAMASRRPVIGYRGGSVHEVIGDAGMIVENGDTAGLREKLERLIDDAALRQEMGHRGVNRVVDEFNPAKSFEQVKQIYRAIVPSEIGKSVHAEQVASVG